MICHDASQFGRDAEVNQDGLLSIHIIDLVAMAYLDKQERI